MRAVHRLRHQHRQQRARRADERSAHDQHVLVQHEAGAAARQAGERVEQRDDDGHVGAADRQHEQHAEREGAEDQRRAASCGPNTIATPSPTKAPRAAGSCRPSAPGDVSAALTRPWSFAKATMLPAKEPSRSAPRARSPRRRWRSRSPGSGDRVVELRDRDQRRRAAADAVEQRHHLRHRGHLHGRAPTTPMTAPIAMAMISP